jgi:hypothetical protein
MTSGGGSEKRSNDESHEAVITEPGSQVCSVCGRWESNGIHEPPREYPSEPISPEFRARLIAAVERPIKVRREILLLAGHASGHLMGAQRACRVCHADWPCASVHAAARSALDAFADCGSGASR